MGDLITIIKGLISSQTNLEILLSVYFIITIILVLISKLNNYLNKKKNSYLKKTGVNAKVRNVIKLLLLINMMCIFIAGCLINSFVSNLLVYATVIVIIYYLAEAVFIENGTITKLFNAEVKYDTIAENTNYLECILNKNELNVTMIAVTNEFIKSTSPLITNIDEAYESLCLIAKEYVDQFELTIQNIAIVSDSGSLINEVQAYINKINIYCDAGDLESLVRDIHKGIIRQINENTFIVPIIGLKYKGVIAIRGKEIDSIDASIIKNIGILLY